jgi:hypothetical protein
LYLASKYDYLQVPAEQQHNILDSGISKESPRRQRRFVTV